MVLMNESLSVLEASKLIINHAKIWHNLDIQEKKSNNKAQNVSVPPTQAAWSSPPPGFHILNFEGAKKYTLLKLEFCHPR